jgi:hypothetical protein
MNAFRTLRRMVKDRTPIIITLLISAGILLAGPGGAFAR